ncbi:MAG TPA: hypothetical protein VNF04_14735 [Stellaceae bacterium]|nr:hypothetical protein [Stellaceae bacterium]
MSEDILREVVTLGGLALELEDCLVRTAVYNRGKHGGLVRNQNERYYQFVVWRAVLARWDAVTEKTTEGWDLKVIVNDQNHYFEMKNWKNGQESRQFRNMQKDVDKLYNVENGYILIISDNPRGQTDANLDYLSKHLVGLGKDSQEYRFCTYAESGDRHEFWIAGWTVKRSVSAK